MVERWCICSIHAVLLFEFHLLVETNMSKTIMPPEYVAALAVVKASLAAANEAAIISGVAYDAKIAAADAYDKLYKAAHVALEKAKAACDDFNAAFNIDDPFRFSVRK